MERSEGKSITQIQLSELAGDRRTGEDGLSVHATGVLDGSPRRLWAVLCVRAGSRLRTSSGARHGLRCRARSGDTDLMLPQL